MANDLALSMPDGTTLDDWTTQGHKLVIGFHQLNWYIGDWLNFGIEKFGPEAQTIALNTFQKTLPELTRAIDVATKFPPDQRRPELSFSHHKHVVKLDDEQAKAVLDKAVQSGQSASEVKKAVAEIRESEGGDVFNIMASVNHEQLVDDWTGKMTRLCNRAPSQEARDQFIELLASHDNGLILE